MFTSIAPGTGVAVTGCTATAAEQSRGEKATGVEYQYLALGARASTPGDQANIFTDLGRSSVVEQTLTTAFVAGEDLASLVAGEAHPTCAAALVYAAHPYLSRRTTSLVATSFN